MKRFFTNSLLVLLCITGSYAVSTAQTMETFEGYGFNGSNYPNPSVTIGSFVYTVSNNPGYLGNAAPPAALFISSTVFSIKKADGNAFQFVSFHADDENAARAVNVTGYLKGVAVTATVPITIPTTYPAVNFDFTGYAHFDEVDSVVMTSSTMTFFLEDWTYNLAPATYAPVIFTNPANTTVCAGSNTSFTVAGTDAPTSYTWQYSSNNGSSWTTITSSSAIPYYTNYTSATLGVVASGALNGYQYRAFATNGVGTSASPSNAATLTVNTNVTWNGGTSTDWNTVNNWTGGCVPSSTVDAVIPVVSTQPTIPGSATMNVQNLTIASGASLTITSGSTLAVAGTSVTNNGSINGVGGIVKIGGTAQATLSGNGVYGGTLQLDNSAGAIVGNTTSDTVKITSGGNLQLTIGTFTSRDKLMLVGDATGCGTIGDVTSLSTISGNVIISNYNLTAQRGYRMMGHPFTGNIPLSSLLPYIDISGASGFTAGANTNPSAYYFNPATSTGSGGSGGWIPYTDASQTWNQANSLLLFVRGQAGQGLNTPYGYSISAPAISLTGAVNITSPNIVLQSSAYTGAAGWNLVPNVLPTNVYVYTTTINNLASAGISTSIYVWNPLKGSTRPDSLAGGYDAYLIASAPVIPMFGAFFIKNTSTATGGTHIGDVTISYKPGTASANGLTPLKLLGASAPYPSGITFTLTSDNDAVYWDKTYLLFQKDATSKDNDKDDFDKMNNAGLNMYTVADSNKYLAVDARPEPVRISDAIALGITTQQQRVFTLKASDVYLDNPELYLHDKYTETWTKIVNNMQYQFAVTADSNTKGNSRFEIAPKVASITLPPVDSTVTTTPAGLTLKAGPNPVQNQLTIHYTLPAATATALVISNSNGQVIHSMDAGTVVSGTKTVNTSNWAAGVYFIQLKTAAGSVTQQIVKE